MKNYRIALLSGDGVGPELIQSARRVLDVVQKLSGVFKLEFLEYPLGRQALEISGQALPEQTLQGIRSANAALIGAISTGEFTGASPIGRLRKELKLFADVRLVKAFPGGWSLKSDIDLVCIRENTEGFLADRNLYKGYGEFMPTEDTVMSLRILTREGCERITRFAFDYARTQQRRSITIAHKANVLKMGCGFFLECAREIARQYPDIELKDEYVDSVANNLIAMPEKYDVILTTNLFGDIISDEAAALVSSLVPTGNIGGETAVFLPVNHNARDEEVGKNTANPLPLILCAGMMLTHLGESSAGRAVEQAVRQVLAVVQHGSPGGDASRLTERICHQIGF